MFIQRVSDFCAKFNNVLLKTAAYGAVAAAASGVIAYHLTPYVSSSIAPWTTSLTKVCYTLPESCSFTNSGILTRAKLECLTPELKCVDSEFMIGSILGATLFGAALTAAFLYKKLRSNNQPNSSLKTVAPAPVPVHSSPSDAAAEVPRIVTRSSRIEEEARKAMDVLKREGYGNFSEWSNKGGRALYFGYILFLFKMRESDTFENFQNDCTFYLKEIPNGLTEDLYNQVKDADVSDLLDNFPTKFQGHPVNGDSGSKRLYYLFSTSSKITQEETHLIDQILWDYSEVGVRAQAEYNGMSSQQLAKALNQIVFGTEELNFDDIAELGGETGPRLRAIIRAPGFKNIHFDIKEIFLVNAARKGYFSVVRDLLKSPFANELDAETLGQVFFNSAENLDVETIDYLKRLPNYGKIPASNLLESIRAAAQTFGFYDRRIDIPAQIAFLTAIKEHPSFASISLSSRKQAVSQASEWFQPEGGRNDEVHAFLREWLQSLN